MALTLRRNHMHTDTGRRPDMLLTGVVCVCLLLAAALFQTYASQRARQASYQMGQAIEQQRQLLEAGRRLRVAVNNLRAPQRLEQEALREGMARPGPQNTRRLQ